MAIFPLVFTTIAIVLPTILHRWEHVGVSPHLPAREWAKGLWSVVLAIILSFVAALFALSVARGKLEHLIPLAAITVLLFPWPLTRYVLIPLGWWRAASGLAQLAGWVWRGDVASGQLVAGAWAVLRQRTPDVAAIAQLSAQRDALEPLGATGILASALLQDAVGDREAARQLMRMVASFDDAHRPPLTRLLADEWLIADAAARGAWAEVEQLARVPLRRSRGARLLGAIAARLIGYPPVPSDAELILRWLIAPSRTKTLASLRQALAQPRAEIVPETRQQLTAPIPALDGPALLAAHRRAISQGSVPLEQLVGLAHGWERMLCDPGLRSRTAKRALALRGGDPDEAIARLGREIELDLFGLARAADLPLAPLEQGHATLRKVARELRHELLDDLAMRCEGVEARVAARRPLPPLDELREFLAVRAQYERTCRLGGPELVRVAFAQVHDPLCTLAVWLWDERGESAIANAMFRWLAHEATIAGDEEAAELQRRNMACIAS
ncbi:hypothetical protein G6O69_28090 [Pseudenhygromyxa sp. WMMC2535]|uniref:hypothetical protein n=1 Tax=Pseudenhygromyxa sp. WMMC2535 TaxID=2712867 RepID=UPI0015548A13|nr:hypothetical protein [Pseudenhygromyxa sp. WMMC2535]NVB41727.1 hypothetical protein [Pseudenhygromyxa sp. WMMC2535]